MGLSLPKTYTADIIDFSLNSPCRRWLTQDSEEQNFSYREISKGRLPDGRQAVIADIVEPMRCKSISLVAADPKLLEIATGYLGFVPTKANTRLWWSIKEEGLDDIGELKKLYHKVDMFHYDYGYQYIYVYFYLTPTNANSGAHVVIKNTHKKKYFRQLFSSRYHSDGSVVRTFPKHSWTIVEGGVGDGFIEDPNCLHKGMMPKKKDRLILQVRYT